MKPNGLVFAASMTSQTSMPMRSHMSASSFTRAMLTARKVFSSSFTISATRGRAHRDDRLDRAGVERGGQLCAGRGDTANDLRELWVLECGLPGSTRSGENARKKSSPALSPLASSSGCTTSSVVPG